MCSGLLGNPVTSFFFFFLFFFSLLFRLGFWGGGRTAKRAKKGKIPERKKPGMKGTGSERIRGVKAGIEMQIGDWEGEGRSAMETENTVALVTHRLRATFLPWCVDSTGKYRR
jgi:hypothetical protein